MAYKVVIDKEIINLINQKYRGLEKRKKVLSVLSYITKKVNENNGSYEVQSLYKFYKYQYARNKNRTVTIKTFANFNKIVGELRGLGLIDYKDHCFFVTKIVNEKVKEKEAEIPCDNVPCENEDNHKEIKSKYNNNIIHVYDEYSHLTCDSNKLIDDIILQITPHYFKNDKLKQEVFTMTVIDAINKMRDKIDIQGAWQYIKKVCQDKYRILRNKFNKEKIMSRYAQEYDLLPFTRRLCKEMGTTEEEARQVHNRVKANVKAPILIKSLITYVGKCIASVQNENMIKYTFNRVIEDRGIIITLNEREKMLDKIIHEYKGNGENLYEYITDKLCCNYNEEKILEELENTITTRQPEYTYHDDDTFTADDYYRILAEREANNTLKSQENKSWSPKKFNNFRSREYEWDILENALLGYECNPTKRIE